MNELHSARAFLAASAPTATAWPLSPHEDAEIESWCCRGYFAGTSVGERSFMISLSCRRADGDDLPHGWMCLISVQEPMTGAYSVTSRISPQLVERFERDAPDGLRQLGVAGHLADAFVREIRSYGPPRPIEVGGAPLVSPAPLEIVWGDIALRQEDGLMELTFLMPSRSDICRMTFLPQAPWRIDAATGRNFERGGGCVCFPRLDMKGTIGKRRSRE